MIDEEIKEISDFLISKSAEESNFHPIDRFFLEPFIDQIVKLDRNQFLLYNFQYDNTLYSSYLFFCLPELWEDITIDDLISIMKNFSTDYSYFSFIYFTYKFVEIDCLKLIFGLPFLNIETKEELRRYIKSQYTNLLKSETDYFFLSDKVIGIHNEVWMSIKDKLINDSRVTSALGTMEELKFYVKSI